MKVVKLFVLSLLVACSGCLQKPLVTARKISDCGVPGKRVGIPYYLPKPYLVITKNVRYIPALTTGLTEPAAVPDSFDSSAGELKIQGDISQSRSVAVERKIQELEEDKRYTEEKFQRIEEYKKYTEEKLQEIKEDKRYVEDKFQRLEEDKRYVEEKLQRLEEDKRLIERKVTELTEDKQNLERKIHDLEQRSTTTTISKDPGVEAKLEALREELESVKAKLDELAKHSQPNSNPGTAQPTPEIANPQAESGTTSASSQATGGPTRQVLGLRDVSVVPSGRIEDGLVPETFYTYQIIFLPDMAQRYGLVLQR